MLQLKTTKLQEMVTKAFKGVGNDRNKPITELIALKVADGVFTLTTTDYDNYLYINESVDSDDFYAVVRANQFIKLVSKLTSEDVSLDVVDNCLEVKANGTYKIPVEIDPGTGAIVEYTDPLDGVELTDDTKIGVISAEDVSVILRAIKPALAVSPDIPQYMNYYMGDTVLSTDTNTASCFTKKLVDVEVLISAVAMDILGVYSDDAPIFIYKIGNRLVFDGNGFVLFGYAMPGVDEYKVSAVNSYLESAYPSKCKLPKQELLQALDRLSLFVSALDEDKISMDFTEDGLVLSSKQSDSVETIKYIDKDNIEPTACSTYLYMLSSQIKAQTGDTIDLYFGEAKSIKIVDDACKVVSVLCLIS